MKKIFLSFICIFIGIINVNAKTISVEFSDCVDGDTAKFIYKKEEITARFLAIDTPETVHPTKGEESYGKEASEYTCNKLKEAKEIKLEYDEDSDKLDKYDRHLVWVFVDGELLQKKLISKGLASVAYLYGDYKYTNILEEAEQIAEDKKIGIWSNDLEDYSDNEVKNNIENKTLTKMTIDELIDTYKEYIILIGIIIIWCIFSAKGRKKVKNKIEKKITSEINKKFK